MKKKLVISVAAAVVLIAAVIAVIAFNKTSSVPPQTYTSMEDAVKEAAFNMEYPDRLCGIPATGFEANSSTIEARYGSNGYIRKTLGVKDNSGDAEEYNESRKQSVNGMTVTMKGEDGFFYLAVWNDNNFAYTIHASQGVTVDEMIEYIEATR